MLSQKMLDALNDQVNAEYYSAYLYRSMAAHCDAINFRGFGKWFREQAKEEDDHAMKFQQYILDRFGRVELKPIQAPPNTWNTPLAVFEAALEHERHVTSRINALAEMAAAEKDFATGIFLQWFITEQVEEESTVDQIVQQMRMTQGSAGGMFWLDRHLGKRGET